MRYYKTDNRKLTFSGREVPVIDVFAAACAAQRLNKGFFKEDFYRNMPGGKSERVLANKNLTVELLKDRAYLVTDRDREEAEAVRGYWQLKLFSVLADTAGPYEKSAVEVAGRESVFESEWFKAGLIASLPSGYERGVRMDRVNEIKEEAKFCGEYAGPVGGRVEGTVLILNCVYSKTYEMYYVTGKVGKNLVMFASKTKVTEDAEFQIKGRIKQHRDGNVTQLNYVKLK
jgi:hypothetical protein